MGSVSTMIVLGSGKSCMSWQGVGSPWSMHLLHPLQVATQQKCWPWWLIWTSSAIPHGAMLSAGQMPWVHIKL